MLIPREFLLGFSESGFQFEMGLPGSEDPNSDWWTWARDRENVLSGIVSGDLLRMARILGSIQERP